MFSKRLLDPLCELFVGGIELVADGLGQTRNADQIIDFCLLRETLLLHVTVKQHQPQRRTAKRPAHINAVSRAGASPQDRSPSFASANHAYIDEHRAWRAGRIPPDQCHPVYVEAALQ